MTEYAAHAQFSHPAELILPSTYRCGERTRDMLGDSGILLNIRQLSGISVPTVRANFDRFLWILPTISPQWRIPKLGTPNPAPKECSTGAHSYVRLRPTRAVPSLYSYRPTIFPSYQSSEVLES